MRTETNRGHASDGGRAESEPLPPGVQRVVARWLPVFLAVIGLIAAGTEQNSPRLDRHRLIARDGFWIRDGVPVFLTALPVRPDAWTGGEATPPPGAAAFGVRSVRGIRDALQRAGCNAAGLPAAPGLELPGSGPGSGEFLRMARDLDGIPLFVFPLSAAGSGTAAPGYEWLAPRAAAPGPEALGEHVSMPASPALWSTLIRNLKRKGGNPLMVFVEPRRFRGPGLRAAVRFPEWLAGRYPTVAAADARWGTHFSRFQDVAPALAGGPRKVRGPWIDWFGFLDQELGARLRAFQQALRPERAEQFPLVCWTPAGLRGLAFACFPRVAAAADGISPAASELFSGRAPVRARGLFALALARTLGRWPRAKPVIHRVSGSIDASEPAGFSLDAVLWLGIAAGGSGAMIQPDFPFLNAPAATAGVPTDSAPESLRQALRRFRTEVDRVTALAPPRPRARATTALLFLAEDALVPAESGEAVHRCVACFDALSRAHYACDIVPAGSWSDPRILDAYDVVIAPRLDFCPDSLRRTLERYVRRGGILVAGPAAFTHDIYGRPRDPEPFLGLRFRATPPGEVHGGLLLETNAGNRAVNGRFRRAAAVELTAAGRAGRWPDRALPALARRRFGAGQVFTCLFTAAVPDMSRFYRTLLEPLGILPEARISPETAGPERGPVRIAEFGDASCRAWLLAQAGGRPRLVRFQPSLSGKGPWYVVDARRWEGILSPAETPEWTTAQILAGFPLILPAHGRELILISKKPIRDLTGERFWNAAWARYAAQPGKRPGAGSQAPAKKGPTAAPRPGPESRRPPAFSLDPRYAFPVDLRPKANAWRRAFVRSSQAGRAGPDRTVFDTGGIPWFPANGNHGDCIALDAGGGEPGGLPSAIEELWLGRKTAAALFLLVAPAPDSRGVLRMQVYWMDGNSREIRVPLPPSAAASPGTVQVRPARLPIEPGWPAAVIRWANPRPKTRLRNLNFAWTGRGNLLILGITGFARERPLPPGVAAGDNPVILGFFKWPGWKLIGVRGLDARLIPAGRTLSCSLLDARVLDSGTAAFRFEREAGGQGRGLAKTGKERWTLACEVRAESAPGSGKRPPRRHGPLLRVTVRPERRRPVSAVFPLFLSPGSINAGPDRSAAAGAAWQPVRMPLGRFRNLRSIDFRLSRVRPGQVVEVRKLWLFRRVPPAR